MYFPPYRIPIAKVDDDDPGISAAVTAADAATPLTQGWYIIAADSVPLRWKLGDDAVTTTTGAFLGPYDQQVIRVPAGGDNLRYIRDGAATADGRITINVAQFPEIDTENPRP